ADSNTADPHTTRHPSSGVTLTDQRGKKLVLDHPVTRLLTIPMPAASIVIAVDKTSKHLVGMHDASWVAMKDGILGQMFPDALKIPHDVAGNDFAPNVESVLALKPEVVVQWANQGSGVIAPMENAGLDVLGVTYGKQKDVATWLTLFATLLGKPERAKAMIAKINTELKKVKSLTANVSGPAPKLLYFNRYIGGLKVAGPDTYNDWYIKLVGATNPASALSEQALEGMVGVDVEQVLAWDPDVVVLGNFDDAMPDDIYGDKVWQDVSAVKSRRVYKVPLGGYRWDPPSHESPLMWRWLSHIAYPHQSPPDLRHRIVDYYTFLYGYTPNDSQIDKILWTDVNDESANYGQFDAT
ncbi:MAG: ABC transporter substrate-binding protein, partial [Nocardioidaceae bacterium]